jgi:hypothetical protein
MTDSVSRTVEIAQIVDVRLDASTAQYADPDSLHLPINLEGASFQTKKGVRGSWMGPVTGDDSPQLFVRFEFGIRVLLSTAQRVTEEGEPGRELGRIEATFTGQYRLAGSEPSQEAVDMFARTIGMFNAWPYWREHAHDLARRMGWHGLVVPLFKLRFQENEQVAVKKPQTRRKKTATAEQLTDGTKDNQTRSC